MLTAFRDFFGRKRPVPQKGGRPVLEPHSGPPVRPGQGNAHKLTFTKVFRYRLPAGQTVEPQTVTVVGSFTNWQPVALTRDGVLDAWHVTVHHIPGNRTHHYMLLVNDRPTFDHTCDGLATPHGMLEEQYQLATDKGPRVLMLFAQTR